MHHDIDCSFQLAIIIDNWQNILNHGKSANILPTTKPRDIEQLLFLVCVFYVIVNLEI